MSLRSSNSLLETSSEAAVRILPMNATGNDAKKGLSCKNAKKRTLSGAVYSLASSSSVFSLVALKELPVENNLQISKLRSWCSQTAEEIGKRKRNRSEKYTFFLNHWMPGTVVPDDCYSGQWKGKIAKKEKKKKLMIAQNWSEQLSTSNNVTISHPATLKLTNSCFLPHRNI